MWMRALTGIVALRVVTAGVVFYKKEHEWWNFMGIAEGERMGATRIKTLLTAGLALATIALALSLSPAVSRAKAQAGVGDSLADLERRISILEKTGPFQVIGRGGKTILHISSNGTVNEAMLFSGGMGVATMSTSQDGGSLMVRTDDNFATMSSERGWTGLRFEENVLERNLLERNQYSSLTIAPLELGRSKAGNYALRFPAKSGAAIAGIGESQAGSGALVVGDSGGKKLASLEVGQGNKGMINVFHRNGTCIAMLGEAVGNTGGALAIGNEAGEPRVKIGTNGNRYGVVEALPLGMAYVPRSGLPGSQILGCAAGPSCVH